MPLVLQGKRIQDVAFRMHVAQPKPRDRQGRPPVIPADLAAARARKDAGEKKRSEKDVEVGCLTSLSDVPSAWLGTLLPEWLPKPGSHSHLTTVLTLVPAWRWPLLATL